MNNPDLGERAIPVLRNRVEHQSEVRAVAGLQRRCTGSGARLRQVDRTGHETIAVYADPAPYCLPPVDLFTWKIVLLPRLSDPEKFHFDDSVVSIRPVDEPSPEVDHPIWTFAPISWSNKPFEIIFNQNENLKSN